MDKYQLLNDKGASRMEEKSVLLRNIENSQPASVLSC